MTSFKIYLPRTHEVITEYTPNHLDEVLHYVERLISDQYGRKAFPLYWKKGADGNYYCQRKPFPKNTPLPPANEEDYNKFYAIVKPLHIPKADESSKTIETVSNLINDFLQTKASILSSQSNYYLIQIYIDDEFVTLPIGPFLDFDSALKKITKMRDLLPNTTFRLTQNKTTLILK